MRTLWHRMAQRRSRKGQAAGKMFGRPEGLVTVAVLSTCVEVYKVLRNASAGNSQAFLQAGLQSQRNTVNQRNTVR